MIKVNENDVITFQQLKSNNKMYLMEVKSTEVFFCTKLVIYQNENYSIRSVTDSNGYKIVVLYRISTHKNHDNSPGYVIHDENAVICPSCGYFLDHVYKKTDRCPKCDQQLLW